MSLSSLDMDDDLDKPLNLIIDILKENRSSKANLQRNNDVLKEICLRQSKESEKLRQAVDENDRQKEILQDLMLNDNPQLQKLKMENISLRTEIEALNASQKRNEALEDALKAFQEKYDSLEDKLQAMDTLEKSNSGKEEKIRALEKENAALVEKTKCNLQRENARLSEVERLTEIITDLQEKLTIKDNTNEDLRKKYQSLEGNKKNVFNFQAENEVLKQALSESQNLKRDNLKLIKENKILTIKLQDLYDSERLEELDEANEPNDILRKQKCQEELTCKPRFGVKCDLQEELTCKPGFGVKDKIHDDDATNIRGQSDIETQRGLLANLEIEASNKDTGPEITYTCELNNFEQMMASAVGEVINTDSLGSNGNPDVDKRLSKTDEVLPPLEPNCDTPSVEDLRMEHERTVAELRRVRDIMFRSLKDIKGNIP